MISNWLSRSQSVTDQKFHLDHIYKGKEYLKSFTQSSIIDDAKTLIRS